MIVFPAIDIKNGRCVRLRQGEASDVTVYGEDPVETALSFEEAGAEFLHVVDLDGAFEGKGVNTPLIRSICEAVSIPVETGGGIRTMDDIEERIDTGVFRVIIGSRAVEDPSFAAKAAARWKDRIAVSIDARGDEAAVHGWTKSGGVKVMPLAKELLSSGVSTIIYTDISKDGMLTGPNFEMLEMLQALPGISLIASGGVSSPDDLKKLQDMGIYGAICGKALYEGRVTMEDIQKLKE